MLKLFIFRKKKLFERMFKFVQGLINNVDGIEFQILTPDK